MQFDRIDAEADNLYPAPVEFRLDAGHIAELGGADRREILGVGEQHGPTIAEPVVKPNAALSGVGLEIGGGIAELQCHPNLSYLLEADAQNRSFPLE